MERVGMIDKYILPNYEPLHSESRDVLAERLVECLTNWEEQVWIKNDTIHLYIAGLMDLESTLKELSKHQPNNQMCLLNQSITDKYLVYDGTEELW